MLRSCHRNSITLARCCPRLSAARGRPGSVTHCCLLCLSPGGFCPLAVTSKELWQADMSRMPPLLSLSHSWEGENLESWSRIWGGGPSSMPDPARCTHLHLPLRLHFTHGHVQPGPRPLPAAPGYALVTSGMGPGHRRAPSPPHRDAAARDHRCPSPPWGCHNPGLPMAMAWCLQRCSERAGPVCSENAAPSARLCGNWERGLVTSRAEPPMVPKMGWDRPHPSRALPGQHRSRSSSSAGREHPNCFLFFCFSHH